VGLSVIADASWMPNWQSTTTERLPIPTSI
jgi:hypothetical protein